MKTTFKLIAILLIVVLSIAACKKEKQNNPNCTLSSIQTPLDSISFFYNSQNKINYINSNSDGFIFEMNFATDGIYENVYLSDPSFPDDTIVLALNPNGTIYNFSTISLISGTYYTSFVEFRYNSNRQIIKAELVSYRNGSIPHVSWKDSLVYSNGNVSKIFTYYKPSTIGSIYTLASETTIQYSSSLNNKDGLYANPKFRLREPISWSIYYEKYFPFYAHLLGNGTQNLPIRMDVEYSTSGQDTYIFNNQTDENGYLVKQTITGNEDGRSINEEYRYYRTCR